MEKFRYSVIFYIFFIFLSGAILVTSCRKDDDIEPNIANQDFYKLMVDWYYWHDEMPRIDPQMYYSPYEVMEALRYKPLDRWSYITSKEEFEAYYKESKFIGYGFGSAFDQDGKLRVSFIFNTSDMYLAGVRRSWIIEKINGTNIHSGMNINPMLGANESGVSNSFLFRRPDGSEVEMTIQKKEVFMNSVLHEEVIEVGGTKVGYMVLKGFTNPTFEELDKTFEFFNSEGIDDLILDLRYNGGGQTDVANYLASIIGGEDLTAKPFARYIYNEKRAAQNFTDTFQDTPISLGLSRLITITTKGTASASEMVINGLRPFIPVIIIGDDTYGKPMGMNAWYYKDMYAYVPVTFKIANADNFGDYFDGLEADSEVADDISLDFGDSEEASLKEALYFIENGSFSGLTFKKSLFTQPWELMTGLRAEIGSH